MNLKFIDFEINPHIEGSLTFKIKHLISLAILSFLSVIVISEISEEQIKDGRATQSKSCILRCKDKC